MENRSAKSNEQILGLCGRLRGEMALNKILEFLQAAKEIPVWDREPAILDSDLDKLIRECESMCISSRSPCDLCMYNPPSSMDGKPCCYCPACALQR